MEWSLWESVLCRSLSWLSPPIKYNKQSKCMDLFLIYIILFVSCATYVINNVHRVQFELIKLFISSYLVLSLIFLPIRWLCNRLQSFSVFWLLSLHNPTEASLVWCWRRMLVCERDCACMCLCVWEKDRAGRGFLPALEWVFPQETIQLEIDGDSNT